MLGKRASRLLFIVLGSWVVLAPAGAQTTLSSSTSTSTTSPSHYPPALPKRRGPPIPPLTLARRLEVSVPGRPTGPLAVVGGEARLPLEGALAVIALDGDPPALRLVPAASGEPSGSPASDAPWVESEDGRFRFRCLPQGRVEGEKRTRFGKEPWKRKWSLRIPGPTVAEPLVFGERVLFPSHDGRVYCLKSKNGHRVWTADVGDRVSRPLTLWTGTPRPDPDLAPDVVPGAMTLALVVPDAGGTLLALDPYDGTRVATLDLPAREGKLATAAVAGPGERVLVAREEYSGTESALLVIEVAVAPPPPAPPEGRDTVGRSTSEVGTTGH